MNSFRKKVKLLIEYLMIYIEKIERLFVSLLGKPYEQVIEKSREQTQNDFEKDYE